MKKDIEILEWIKIALLITVGYIMIKSLISLA